jgi:O-antigen/teichoic acid export membrane protein
MLLSSACGLVDVVLITVGKTTWNLLDTLLAFVVNVGVDLLLIPRFGITGAAIGWALAIVVRNVAALVQVSSRFGFRPLSRLSVDVAASAAVAFAAVPGAALIAFGDDSRAIAVAVAAGAAGYALQLWWMRRRLHLDFVAGRRLE